LLISFALCRFASYRFRIVPIHMYCIIQYTWRIWWVMTRLRCQPSNTHNSIIRTEWKYRFNTTMLNMVVRVVVFHSHQTQMGKFNPKRFAKRHMHNRETAWLLGMKWLNCWLLGTVYVLYWKVSVSAFHLPCGPWGRRLAYKSCINGLRLRIPCCNMTTVCPKSLWTSFFRDNFRQVLRSFVKLGQSTIISEPAPIQIKYNKLIKYIPIYGTCHRIAMQIL